MGKSFVAGAGSTVRHPLDNAERLCVVLSGSSVTSGAKGGLLEAIRKTSEYLSGSGAPDVPKYLVGSSIWGAYLRGIGDVVIRAVSPVVPEQDREYLLAVLDTWADTVFADRAARFRMSEFSIDADVPPKPDESAIELSTGRRIRRFVGRAADGHEVVWGDAAQLRTLTAAVRSRGPLPWDPEAVRVLADESGLSRAAAALILAGCLDRARVGDDDLLTTEQRAILGMTRAELLDGAAELAEVRGSEYGCATALLTAALPTDPEELWRPDGSRALAARLAAVWNTRFGRRAAVPESTRAAAISVRAELNAIVGSRGPSAARLCALTADPDMVGDLAADDLLGLWTPLISLCRWAYAFLPAGDPVRAGVPRTIESLRLRLRAPELVLYVGYVEPSIMKSVQQRRTASATVDSESDPDRFDDGLIVAEKSGYDGSWKLSIRPACFRLDDRTRDLRGLLGTYSRDRTDELDWLFGAECDRLLSRITDTSALAGGFETDPARSAPDLVAEVAAALDLTADAAALYLQLATLTAPTDRNVRIWNGWKPAQHGRAETALLEKQLVVRDKRGRAGRTLFLPGPWIEKPGIEQSKWVLHGLQEQYREKFVRGMSSPRTTLPELFRAVWERLRSASITPAVPSVDPGPAQSIPPQVAAEPRPTTGRDAAAVDPHPRDHYGPLCRALDGRTNQVGTQQMLRGIRITSNLLSGDELPAAPEQWIHAEGGGIWAHFVHGITGVVLRAVNPGTPPADRPYLLAFLEVWAETIFADPTARLRHGWTATAEPLTGNAGGTAVSLDESAKGSAQFIDVRHGESEPPTLGEIRRVTPVGARWGSAAQLRTLIELIGTRGPVPWDRAAAKLFAQRTGLSRAAAALTLAGYIGWYLTAKEDVDADQRRILGLTTAAVEDGARELNNLTDRYTNDTVMLLANILPEDPAELWEPAGMREVAARAADAWITRHGRRAAVPEPSFAAALAVRTELCDSWSGPSMAELCSILLAPAAAKILTDPIPSGNSDPDSDENGWRPYVFKKTWPAVIETCRWAYAGQPAGDPLRNGVVKTLEILRARLRDPALVLSLGTESGSDIEAFVKLSGVLPVTDVKGRRTYDDGLVIATGGRDSDRWDLSFRPAHYRRDAHTDLLRTTVNNILGDKFEHLEWIFGPNHDRIADRLNAADLPEGRYETEPILTVPEVVADASSHLGISADAATLYLQYLALLNPTDRNIRTWNRWNPEQHSKIEDELRAKFLLVRDSRKGAGRTVFLPSAWISKPGVETWKLPLHDLRARYRRIEGDPIVHAPRHAIPDLYRAAWQRIRAGDVPKWSR